MITGLSSMFLHSVVSVTQSTASVATLTGVGPGVTAASDRDNLSWLSNGAIHDLIFRRIGMSDASMEVDALFMMIQIFCVFFFVLLMALMVYFAFKYRRRPGVPAPVSASHNTPLEIVWTIVPSSSMLVIFLFGYWTYMKQVVPGQEAMQLDVSAYKWGWTVTQPNGVTSNSSLRVGSVDAPIFYVPENTPIKFKMQSVDVIHSFWIPDLRVKMDVMPNRFTGYTIDTIQLQEGEDYRDLWVFCAEYCGTLHSEMAAVMRVVRRKDYEQWLIDANTGGMSPVELGELVWKQKCITCHSIDGSPATGPTWLNLYGSSGTFTNGTSIDNKDATYLREQILNPNSLITTGYPAQMASFAGLLSDDELNGLIAFMQSVSEFGPAMSLDELDAGDAAEGETPDSQTDAQPVAPPAQTQPENPPEPSAAGASQDAPAEGSQEPTP